MPVESGQSLLHYRIVDKLGEGGMGVVWKAVDTRLRREVAIKVLPPELAGDRRRLDRLQHEARVLARLEHPNVAAVYGLEECAASDGETVRFLVMQLVGGQTLAERIERGPLPLGECLALARDIAAGLHAAHDAGIVHRDLKPSNVALSVDGTVRLLDFGLARERSTVPVHGDEAPEAIETATSEDAPSFAGTVPYMAPEQLRGAVVDSRADVWAFGCVLFEMLTGRMAFPGASVSDSLAAILGSGPDWERLPKELPAEIRRLLQRCLRVDRQRRLHHIADAGIEIEDALEGGHDDARPPTARRRPGGRLSAAGWCLGGVVLGAALIGVWQRGRSPDGPGATDLPRARFEISLPEGLRLQAGDYPERALALSPDGRRIAYVGGDNWYATRLYLRSIDSLDLVPVPGSDAARQPFFSPDGERVGFFNRSGELRIAPAAGGEPIVVARGIPGSGWSFGSWGDDNRIVFTTWGDSALGRVSIDGGEVESLQVRRDGWSLTPTVLPGSEVLLYTSVDDSGARIVARRLGDGSETVVLENAANPVYLHNDRLLFSRDGVPLLIGFDRTDLAVTGNAVNVGESVRVDDPSLPSAVPLLAAAGDGTLVFAEDREDTWRGNLVWVDRSGQVVSSASPAGGVHVDAFVQLSADGRRVALSSKRAQAVRLDVLELESGVVTPQLSVSALVPVMAAWLGDSGQLAFSSSFATSGVIRRHAIDGVSSGEPVLDANSLFGVVPWSISPDGAFLAYTVWERETGNDIYFHSLIGAESIRFLATPAFEVQPCFSPDGRAVAYVSDESGSMEVYVRDFPGGENKRKVSRNGGWAPLWSPAGDEIFFQDESGRRTFAAPVRRTGAREVGPPELLFEGPYRRSTDMGLRYAVAADGQRFLMLTQQSPALEVVPRLIVVQRQQALEQPDRALR